MKFKTTFLALFLLSCCQADIKLPALISDHMLLERDVPVRIFGKATPGEAVKVSFRGQTVETVTDSLGRWEVWLAPMKPAPPEVMTIRGNNTVTVSDVLVGDVWIGSGQSNMQWAVRQSGPSGRAAIPRAKSHPLSFRRSGSSMSLGSHRQLPSKTSKQSGRCVPRSR
jgi:sialate O-acetylesterase